METNGINECIQSEVFPHSRQYHTFDELNKDLKNAKKVIVLGIFNDKYESAYYQEQFFEAAHSLANSVQFRHLYVDSVPNVCDFELIKNMKDYSLPYILLIRPKHLWNKYETKFVVHSFGDIIDFIKFNFNGLVGLRTDSTLDYFEFPIINIYSDIDYKNEFKTTIDLRNKILELSHIHREYKFIISDANKFTDELKKYFDFKSIKQIRDSLPIITAEDNNHKRFILKSKPFSIENLNEFILNLKQSKEESVLRLEEYMSSGGSVKEVSALEFEELVINNKKESFIMFYTKGCHYCKRLEKTLEKLGKALENEPNIQIVKQEFISGYFADHFKAEKFPTFYWFDKNKQKVLYYGRHEFNDFIEFIAENSFEELRHYDRFGHLKYSKEEL